MYQIFKTKIYAKNNFIIIGLNCKIYFVSTAENSKWLSYSSTDKLERSTNITIVIQISILIDKRKHLQMAVFWGGEKSADRHYHSRSVHRIKWASRPLIAGEATVYLELLEQHIRTQRYLTLLGAFTVLGRPDPFKSQRSPVRSPSNNK